MATQPNNKERRLTYIRSMQKAVTEETLLSTVEMLRLFNQSQDAGVKTLELLHHQGEQLKHVGGNLNDISANISMANRDMAQIELTEDGWFCLAFCCCCRRHKNVKSGAELSNSNSSTTSEVILDEPKTLNTLAKPGRGTGKTNTINPGHFIPMITNDEVERQIDKNLAQVFDTLLGLKRTAVQMGQVITTQNSQLDGLNSQAAKDQDKLSSAQKRVQRLL